MTQNIYKLNLSNKNFYFYQMGWGFFKKIKNGLTKAFNWVKDKVVKPVINVGKKILGVGVKAAPAIATAIGAAKGNPEIGAMVGSAVQNVGNALGIK